MRSMTVPVAEANALRFLQTDDPDLQSTVTIGIQKGGTGKSTVTAETGYEAARLGARVLLVDFDPNAGLTGDQMGMDVEAIKNGPEGDSLLTTADLLNDCRDGGAVDALLEAPDNWALREDLPWEQGGVLVSGGALAFIPGYVALQAAVEGATNVPAAERRLRRSLRGVARQFDLVLIDSGPRADKVAQTALLAAGTCIAPVLPSFGSMRGLKEQLEFLDAFAAAWEHPIRFAGAFCCSFDRRAPKAHGDGLNDLKVAMTSHKPFMPDVTGRATLSGREPLEFAGDVGAAVWDEILWFSTKVETAVREHRPLTKSLTTIGGSPSYFNQKEAQKVLALSKGYARVALRLLQLTEASCLPRVAEGLIANPIPGVWPTNGQESSELNEPAEGTKE
jgi:cellulose biosynthesis protein BcsQ